MKEVKYVDIVEKNKRGERKEERGDMKGYWF